MNRPALILMILAMTLLGSFGGFFFKKSTGSVSILSVIKSRYLYLGVLFYVAGAVFNIYVLKYMPYNVVLPISSITYVWSLISSRLILKEKLTYRKLIGIVSIIIGATFIALY
jgi:uncharacterized membrane protein